MTITRARTRRLASLRARGGRRNFKDLLCPCLSAHPRPPAQLGKDKSSLPTYCLPAGGRIPVTCCRVMGGYAQAVTPPSLANESSSVRPHPGPGLFVFSFPRKWGAYLLFLVLVNGSDVVHRPVRCSHSTAHRVRWLAGPRPNSIR
jgi:hypothetical protein